MQGSQEQAKSKIYYQIHEFMKPNQRMKKNVLDNDELVFHCFFIRKY